MSVDEIMRRYALHPPPFVAESLRMGRPSKKNNLITMRVISAMRKAYSEGLGSQRDFRKAFFRIVNSFPENMSRPLSVDETVSLCDALGLSVEKVIKLTKDQKEKRE